MARDQLENRPGIVTRRRVLTASAAALGGAILAPAPLRFALAQSKPYKIGTLQPLSGGAAIIGKTALAGVQMATDRINAGGGINGRKVSCYRPSTRSRVLIGLSGPGAVSASAGGERLVVPGDRGVDVGAPACRRRGSRRSPPSRRPSDRPCRTSAGCWRERYLKTCGWLCDSSATSASAQPKRAAPSIIDEPRAVMPLVMPA